MKCNFVLFTLALTLFAVHLSAQTNSAAITFPKNKGKSMYIDVHQLEPGKVKFEDVAKAHAKDLATQASFGVDFMKYWVDEEKGLIYCLSSSGDSSSIRMTHELAHGLLPDHIYQVTSGQEGETTGENDLYLDIHELGAGKVTAKNV